MSNGTLIVSGVLKFKYLRITFLGFEWSSSHFSPTFFTAGLTVTDEMMNLPDDSTISFSSIVEWLK